MTCPYSRPCPCSLLCCCCWEWRDMQSLTELVALSIFIATLLIWAAILGGNLAVGF